MPETYCSVYSKTPYQNVYGVWKLLFNSFFFADSNFATITLFPETLHVYVCEYQPSTVLKTTAQLMYTIKEDTMEPVGTSNYFQRGTSPEIKKVGTVSAVKKRDKLKML